MTHVGAHKSLWLLILMSGLVLGIVPLFIKISAFDPVIVAAGLTLMVAALLGLKRPKRIRLPYKRTLS